MSGSPGVFTATAAGATMTAPTLLGPSSGTILSDLGTTVSWTNSSGALQYEIMVIPFGNDGPGIDLIRNTESSYTIAAPNFGSSNGNYVMLPGMTYTWQVRDSNGSTWGPWAQSSFHTPGVSSSTISLGSFGLVTNLNPTLTWDNTNREVFYYEVQVSKDRNFSNFAGGPMLYWELRHGGVTNPLNSYTIPSGFPLQRNSVYYWRVRPRIQGDGTPLDWSMASNFVTAP